MNILLVEPYFTGSHQQWIEGLMKYSKHDFRLLSLKGKYWKWRMEGGAIALAQQFNEMTFVPQLILVSDMLDLALFKSLLRGDKQGVPCWVYFHENQLSYPFQNFKEVDRHYGFINYTSALVADKVLFNSNYHRQSFLCELKRFLKILPDQRSLHNVGYLRAKSEVVHLGIELPDFGSRLATDVPTFVWNHRWEYDKNPTLFFEVLFQLKERGHVFKLNVLGEKFAGAPSIFGKAKKVLDDEILHWGYAESRERYFEVLQKSNLLLVTSDQDFFGMSVVEAIASGCYPILPSRLAFPEVIPFDNYFYPSDERLLDHVAHVLVKKLHVNTQEILIEEMMKYRWENMVGVYDKLFEEHGDEKKATSLMK